jgi:hypothetical protein
MSAYPSPRVLHVRTAPPAPHVETPGMHVAGLQIPSVEHSLPAPQSLSRIHWTHAPRAGSQVWPIGQSLLSRHRVDVTHMLARHTCPMEQSMSPSQSTQTPRLMLHTCPGHMREVVHEAAVTQRALAHAWPIGQSVSRLQSTQVPVTREHTIMRAEHSRSLVHAVMGASVEGVSETTVRSVVGASGATIASTEAPSAASSESGLAGPLLTVRGEQLARNMSEIP